MHKYKSNVGCKVAALLFFPFFIVHAYALDIELIGTFEEQEGSSNFKSISDLLINEEGHILAIDSKNGNLLDMKIADKTLSVAPLLGSKEAPTAFTSKAITGLAIDKNKDLFIINSGNHIVAKYDIDKKQLNKRFGEKGTKAGMLNKPGQIDVSINNRIYIANQNSVSVFSPNGAFLYDLGNDNADVSLNLSGALQIAVDNRERVYVLGKSSVLSVYAYTGDLLARYDATAFASKFGLKKAKVRVSAITADTFGNLFIAENSLGKIFHFDWEKGEVLGSFGSQGKGPGQYRGITAIDLSESSQLAVADAKNAKVDIYKLKMNTANSLKREWLPNIGAVKFNNVNCTVAYRLFNSDILCLDKKTGVVKRLSKDGKSELKVFDKPVKGAKQAAYDDKYVVVLGSNIVGVYDVKTGKQTTLFGRSGSKDGELSGAIDVALQKRKIYIAEQRNRRVQVFSINGVHLRNIPSNRDKTLFPKLVAVAVDANEYIYVADSLKGKVLVLNDEDRQIYELGVDKPSPAYFVNFADMMFDRDNNLYILANTTANPSTVLVYSGQKKVFQMGSTSKNNRYAMYGAKSISVSPSDKTLISIFNVGGYSKKSDAKGVLDYNYLQIPLPVTDLKVTGGVEETQLVWQKSSANYVQKYKVYGAEENDGEYKFLISTEDSQIALAHEAGKGAKYYKVTATSGFGVDGPSSFPQENIFQNAYLAYQANQYDKSISLLQSLIDESPDNPNALKYLGLNSMALGQYAAAAQYYAQLSRLPEHKVEGLNLQIEALFTNKDYPEAMFLVNEIMQQSDDNVDSLLNCGRLSLKMGDGIGAVECLESLLAKKPKDLEGSLLLGKAYAEVGAVEKGIAQLDMTTKTHASDVNAWVSSGDVLLDLNKYKLAKSKYESALKIDSNHTHAQLGLAKAALQLKDSALTKNIAIKLAGKKETASTGNYLLGLLANNDKQDGPAVLSLSKATKADKTNVDAWILLAEVHQRMGNQAKAKKALQSAVDADPASFAAAKQLGLLLVEEKSYTDAAVLLQTATRLNTKDYETQVAYTKALLATNKLVQAMSSGKAAIALNNKKIQAYELTAEAAGKRGKTGDAIEYLQKAIAIEPDKFINHQTLGELYSDNNLFSEAQAAFKKATVVNARSALPHISLGKLFVQQRNFDSAIKAYQKAVKLDGSSANKLLLDEAIAAKKESLAFDNGAPQVVLQNLRINNVFSAAYKQYANEPIGTVEIKNVSGVDYSNLEVLLSVKGYMDFPTKQVIDKLPANSSKEVPLLASFNNKMLSIDEDTGVQIEVKANFLREGQKGSINVTQAMTVYGKNAIVWSNPNMIGSFVTPKDDSLRDFTRRALNEYKPDRGPLSKNLVNAMTLFDSFAAYGLHYVVDPNNPFTDLSKDQIDYVQFARETLRLKSGDCDDLSVLLSASLENLGIETALLDVPGHVLMMFNTNLPVSQRELVTSNPALVVEYKDSVWVPVEATMISTSFSEAWAEGAKKYYDNEVAKSLNIIAMKDAWSTFQPVTLPPAKYTFELPPKEQVQLAIRKERDILIERSLERLVKPYVAMLQIDPDNQSAQMQVAITYGKYGLYQKALNEFDKLLNSGKSTSSVYNNKGNVYFNKQDYQRAFESYSQAEQLDKNDAGVKLNLAMALYKNGDAVTAADKYREATKLDKSIENQYQAFGKLVLN